MKTEINVFTDSGLMEENQDAYSITVDTQSAVIALCDGLGGHPFPKQTAQFVAKEVVKEIQNSKTSSLQDALMNVNVKVIGSNQYGYTTVVVLKLDYDKKCVSYCNCGDSRIYFLDNKGIEQLSIDHTDQCDLIETYGFEKNMAVFFRKITSCIGMNTKEIQVFSGKKTLDKDGIILLASDGCWKLLENEWHRIAQLRTITEKEEYILQQLQYRAKQSDDNITAILVSFSTN